MGTGKTIVLVDGEAPPRLIPSTRFTLALLVFFAFIVQYAQRVNLPIAIVCMTNRTKPSYPRLFVNDTLSNLSIEAPRRMLSSSTTLKPQTTTIAKRGFLREKQFNWAELQQQILLGSYWAGYIFTQVPGKRALGVCLICWSSALCRRMVSDEHRCQMGLRWFSVHQFDRDAGSDRHVRHVQYTHHSILCSPIHCWSCSWRPLPSHHLSVVALGSAAGTQHSGLDRILWYPPGNVPNDAGRRHSLPVFLCWLDVPVYRLEFPRFYLADLLDYLHCWFPVKPSIDQQSWTRLHL